MSKARSRFSIWANPSSFRWGCLTPSKGYQNMNNVVSTHNTKYGPANSARNVTRGNPAIGAGNGSAALLIAGKPNLNGKMKTPIKVLLVDDHPIVRRGVASCLAKEPGVQVIGEAANGQDALK